MDNLPKLQKIWQPISALNPNLQWKKKRGRNLQATRKKDIWKLICFLETAVSISNAKWNPIKPINQGSCRKQNTTKIQLLLNINPKNLLFFKISKKWVPSSQWRGKNRWNYQWRVGIRIGAPMRVSGLGPPSGPCELPMLISALPFFCLSLQLC